MRNCCFKLMFIIQYFKLPEIDTKFILLFVFKIDFYLQLDWTNYKMIF